MANLSKEEIANLRRSAAAQAAVSVVNNAQGYNQLKNGNYQGQAYQNGGFVDGTYVVEWVAGMTAGSAPC